MAASIGQVYRFAHDMVPGETVVMHDPESRLYHIGKVTGPCKPADDGEGDATYARSSPPPSRIP